MKHMGSSLSATTDWDLAIFVSRLSLIGLYLKGVFFLPLFNK